MFGTVGQRIDRSLVRLARVSTLPEKSRTAFPILLQVHGAWLPLAVRSRKARALTSSSLLVSPSFEYVRGQGGRNRNSCAHLAVGSQLYLSDCLAYIGLSHVCYARPASRDMLVGTERRSLIP